jgi:NhaP-type Na+/H+ or K+/H+ antiporter
MRKNRKKRSAVPLFVAVGIFFIILGAIAPGLPLQDRVISFLFSASFFLMVADRIIWVQNFFPFNPRLSDKWEPPEEQF